MRNPLLLRKRSASPVGEGGLWALVLTLHGLLRFRAAGPEEHRETYQSARHKLRELYRGALRATPPHSRRLIADARMAKWSMGCADDNALAGRWGQAVQDQLSALQRLGGVVSALRGGKVAYGYDICLAGDTPIPLLDGTTVQIKDLVGRACFWVYSLNKEGLLRPGRGADARLTETNAPTLFVALDNGERIHCTRTHRFMLRDGAYKPAEELVPGESLMPFYRDLHPLEAGGNEYERTYQPGTDSWVFTHRFMEARCPRGYVRHHNNLNRFDNTPGNLVLMKWADHQGLHSSIPFELTERARMARRDGMLRLNASHRGASRPELSFSKPWVDGEAMVKYLLGYRHSQGEEGFVRHQKLANVAANHGRWHVSRGVVNPECALCLNHKVLSLEPGEPTDVYDIRVDKYNNFALTAGVFVHNSGELAEVWHGSEDLANSENQKNIKDTGQPFEQHETVPNPANMTRDFLAERDYPSLRERRNKRVHWPPRLR